MIESVLSALAIVLAVGVTAQWIAWRIGLPSILLLLLFGILIGPGLGVLDPGVFGEQLMPFVSAFVALILYEGGLTLKISDLPKVGGVVRNLCTIGALVTWFGAAVSAKLIFGIDYRLAMLLGAILVVTGPTVIGPLLRHIRPTGAVDPILKWEGIVIDPIGATLAVLVLEALFVAHGGPAAPGIAMALLKTVFIGVSTGGAAAALLTFVLAKRWLPDFLQNAVSLMLVVGVFALSNAFQHESGFLSVTLMGIGLANQNFANVRHIVEFKENLRVLLLSGLFIVLAARVELDDLIAAAPRGALYVAVLVLLVRPVSVWVSTLGSKLSRAEVAFLACMAPRGIVAAAVASVFALRLEQMEGIGESARLLTPITFCVIIGTVTIYGFLAPLLARRLGVATPNPQGVLFIGASKWIREVALLLRERDIHVYLIDTNRRNIANAKLEGLPAYNGSALDERLLDYINLGGLGKLLAATPNDWVNVLCVQRFAPLFGAVNCYQVTPTQDSRQSRDRHRSLHGRWAFGERVTYSELERRMAQGFVAKATTITVQFTPESFEAEHGPDAIKLAILDERGRLTLMIAEKELVPKPGETLIALTPPPPVEPKEPDDATSGADQTSTDGAAA